MLRTRTPFPNMLAKLALQVGGSVVATLVASAIFATLPKPTAIGRPAAELTSGGKFAARIPGAGPDADAAGVSREQRSILPLMTLGSAGSVMIPAAEVVWDDALKPPPSVGAEKSPRARPHVAARDARRPVESSVAVLPPSAPVGLVAAADVASARADDGMMPKIISSARSLWSLTAAAGGSLLSHLTP